MEDIFKYPGQTRSLIAERKNNARLSLQDMPLGEATRTDSLINRAASALDVLIDATLATQADDQLSDSYRDEKLTGFKEDFVNEVFATERSAEQFAADAEKALDAVKLPAVDQMLQQARFAEIRQRLAGEDPGRIATRYQKDVAGGIYSELVQALEDDPLDNNFVTDATRRASRLNRCGAADPEAVKRYNATLTGARVARQFAGSVAGLVTGARNGGFCSFG